MRGLGGGRSREETVCSYTREGRGCVWENMQGRLSQRGTDYDEGGKKLKTRGGGCHDRGEGNGV